MWGMDLGEKTVLSFLVSWLGRNRNHSTPYLTVWSRDIILCQIDIDSPETTIQKTSVGGRFSKWVLWCLYMFTLKLLIIIIKTLQSTVWHCVCSTQKFMGAPMLPMPVLYYSNYTLGGTFYTSYHIMPLI